MLKKVNYVLLMLVFLVPMFISPFSVNASGKTLKDLQNELLKKQRELEEINKDKTLTEDKINKIKQNITSIDNEVKTIEKTMIDIRNEIIKLNENIVDKNIEVRELMKFFQLSTGENMYLEYAFGATSMTDFIYRLAIVEQLTKHNDQLITDMNNMIVSQENKSKELAAHQEKIVIKRKELFDEQFKLGDRIKSLNDDVVSISEEISSALKTIKNYENLGCRPNDILADCIKVNQDVSFSRPTLRGLVTCGWTCYLYGKIYYHNAIDIGGITGENIYPTANGTVVDTGYYYDGGNYVIIVHNINGKPYTSRYMHMAKIFVNTNQKVSRDTPIGTVGNTGAASTGAHLHFDIAEGAYPQDFVRYGYSAYKVDPAVLIKFPPENWAYRTRYSNQWYWNL
ncbi:MAG: peptidoglycan DD-metalloendopeptidase family protein [Bacilli bacterium]|nr:peptidoglycan DD-metalloendopeptidase family protein [Bacilli bacterium]MDD4718726.1 peptidoglycan DD-metalloendopeptidase family protein [Bacilli bacterium]